MKVWLPGKWKYLVLKKAFRRVNQFVCVALEYECRWLSRATGCGDGYKARVSFGGWGGGTVVVAGVFPVWGQAPPIGEPSAKSRQIFL